MIETEQERSGIVTSGRLRRLFAHIDSRRRVQFLGLLIISLGGILAELLTVGAVLPVLFIALQPDRLSQVPVLGSAMDYWTAFTSLSPIAAAALFLVIAAVIATATRLLINWYTQRLAFTLNHDLATKLYSRILHRPFEWHAQRHSTVILSGLEKIYVICFGVALPVVNGITSLLITICVVGLLLLIDPVAASLSAVVIGLVYALLILATRSRNSKAAVASAQLRDIRMKTLQESSGGIRDIILDQTQPVFERRFHEMDAEFARVLTWGQVAQTFPRLVVEGALIVLIAVLALWFNSRPGGLLQALPALGAIAIGAQRLLPLIQQIYAGYSGYTLSTGSIDDVLDIIDEPEDRPAIDPATVAPLPFAKAIKFSRVDFHYRRSKHVLHDINLTIMAGERVGIIGKTGSGKSTFADLLMGLLQPTGGVITIDDVALTQDTSSAWKKQIAHVPQHIFLSDDSISANVAFGQDVVDHDRVNKTLEQAGLADWIAGLPDGTNTHVGERGVRLSGGQRQRIGIARALYKDARVLVLDEATSSLDTATEAHVMDAVNALGRDLTIVIIAHRLSTVEPCDRIVRIDGGKIVSIGSYADVVGPVQ